MKKIIKKIVPYMDIFLIPFVYPAAWLLKNIRRVGIKNFPLCKKIFLNLGVFPIINYYYEPQFDYRKIKHSLSENRILPGIDWNIKEQLDFLNKLTYSEELKDISSNKKDDLTFHFNNDAFESGDAEYWYQLIRLKKPKRIFEIGSGHSTLIAIKSIKKIQEEDSNYKCDHVCIEPYEMAWLEKTGVKVIRKKVEDVELSFFSELGEDDILFIDSSHIIRPEGDVLFEYLELIPQLNKGVIVHVHDIFSPRNYLNEWLNNDVRFWNEQYLLEAFLSNNNSWKIIGALNFLQHNHYEHLSKVCPYLTNKREPGSFYMQKIN